MSEFIDSYLGRLKCQTASNLPLLLCPLCLFCPDRNKAHICIPLPPSAATQTCAASCALQQNDEPGSVHMLGATPGSHSRADLAAYCVLAELERDSVRSLLWGQVSLMLCGCLPKAISGAEWCHGDQLTVASDSGYLLQPSTFLSFCLTDSLISPINTELSCLTVSLLTGFIFFPTFLRLATS